MRAFDFGVNLRPGGFFGSENATTPSLRHPLPARYSVLIEHGLGALAILEEREALRAASRKQGAVPDTKKARERSK